MPNTKNSELAALAARIYEETGSGNKVASRLNVSHSTAYRLLRAAGVALPDKHGPEVQAKKRKLAPVQGRAAAKQYASGVPMREIMAEFGVGSWAIKSAVRECGVPMRGVGGRIKDDSGLESMASDYRAGLSQAQIASKHRTSAVRVSRILASHGVEVRRRAAKGENHGRWRGGRSITSQGYVLIHVGRGHPLSDGQGYALEHRLVMSELLGRPLHRHETVHHIDGDKLNNKAANLQLRFGRHGKGVTMKCCDCGSRNISYVNLD